MFQSDNKVDKSHWRPNETVQTCSQCNVPFTVFNRRHHCRLCGGIFCSKCSKNRSCVPIRTRTGMQPPSTSSPGSNQPPSSPPPPVSPSYSSNMNSKPERVCDSCFVLLSKKNRKRETMVL
eukprot:PhF_6_TR40007/c0_g1_i1/m.59374